MFDLGVFWLVVFAVGATRYLPFFWSIACDAQRRHSSKTVTIVLMSAAWEQKKSNVVDVLCGTSTCLEIAEESAICRDFTKSKLISVSRKR